MKMLQLFSMTEGVPMSPMGPSREEASCPGPEWGPEIDGVIQGFVDSFEPARASGVMPPSAVVQKNCDTPQNQAVRDAIVTRLGNKMGIDIRQRLRAGEERWRTDTEGWLAMYPDVLGHLGIAGRAEIQMLRPGQGVRRRATLAVSSQVIGGRQRQICLEEVEVRVGDSMSRVMRFMTTNPRVQSAA
jgi:hypothetical protein